MKNYKQINKVKIKCSCGKEKELLIISVERSIKKHGEYICKSCVSKLVKKPQNTKEFWTEDKRKKHGEIIKSSKNYYEAIAKKDTSGDRNSMFGKKHSVISIQKMSISRRGKIGVNATAWKGGKLSLTRRVKGIMHTRYNWYKRIYERDNYECVNCMAKGKIDAHHINPVWKIIKKLLANKIFENDDEKLEWLVNQPEIIDANLENGETLCRSCHKNKHRNWGSHYVR